MKLLIVTTVSGTMNFFEHQIKELLNQGYEIHLATNFESGKVKFDTKSLNLHQINFSRSVKSKNNIEAYKELKRVLENNDFDIIHTHTPIASTIVRLQKIKTYTKVIYTAHGFHFFKGAPILNWFLFYPIELILARRTDTIITINKEDYVLAKKRFKKAKIELISGVGIDLKKFNNITNNSKYRHTLGIDEHDFVLLCIGELNKNKNQEFLLNIVAMLKEKIPKIKLILVGSGGHHQKLNDICLRKGINNNVIFLGHRDDVPNIIKESDLIVSASFREGLPVNIMEAMASGKPVVVSNCRGSVDIVTDTVNGFVINQSDTEKYSQRILDIYKNKNISEKFAQENLNRISEYSYQKINEDILDIYKRKSI